MCMAAGTAMAQDIVTGEYVTQSMTSENVTELLRGQISGVHVGAIDNNPNGALNVNIRGLWTGSCFHLT